MKRLTMALAICIALSAAATAQTFSGDILGSHNLAPNSPGSVKSMVGGSSASCLYCHAPHSGIGGSTPLWAQTLSAQTYTTYSSTTLQNKSNQPVSGGPSSLCLSCHDGTVAVGQLVPYGNATMTGVMPKSETFGADLSTSHPFSLATPLKDSPNLVATLASKQTTADTTGKVKLINGTVECNSCHEPHQQNLDPVSLNFLVKDSSNGQLCLACHEPNARTVNGQNNPLAQWTNSIHATSVNNVAAAAKLGSYTTVAQFACVSCHMPHNANGAAGLLRGITPPPPNVDASTMSCMTCHSGGSNLQQSIANVYAEITKTSGHPLPAIGSTHDPTEAGVLVNNRHATCADCHNPHASQQVSTFLPPPTIRVSQTGVVGISESDGTTVVSPAAKQYENCLRCHGTSPGKQSPPAYGYLPIWAASAADRLNIISQFASTATSSHPVMHTSTSPWPQPSLLTYMLNLDGVTPSTRKLGSASTDSIFCTDCHNADDNREFGGGGPNGPHGSSNFHMLERRYEFSQVAAAGGPGSPIINLSIAPNLSAGGSNPGPYAQCGKCHDLTNIVSDAAGSFQPRNNGTQIRGGHFTHISEQGVSCSVCHTGHGNGAAAAGITGERLVNFDLKVVAQNGTDPVSYNHATNTCTLTCHNYQHNSNGSVQKWK